MPGATHNPTVAEGNQGSVDGLPRQSHDLGGLLYGVVLVYEGGRVHCQMQSGF